MHAAEVKYLKKPKLKNPIMVEGLPGVGNVGRICASYLVTQLKAKKFAELFSPYFLPLVIIKKDSSIHLLKCDFYYKKGKKKGQRDMIFLVGDSQSLTPHGHYEVCGEILKVAKKFGVKDIITLGGYAVKEPPDEPKVMGAVNGEKLKKKYKKFDIDFKGRKNVGHIVGASGLLLGMGKSEGIDGLCLMGETMSFPIVTDPKAAEAILDVLTKILNVDMDMSKIEKAVGEMERLIKKTEKLHHSMAKNMPSGKKKPDVRYIG